MSDIIIKAENLTKIYKIYDKPIDRLKESLNLSKKIYHREHYSLNDLSFSIKKGEMYGIIGKNGAGKSTLLKILTGVLTPTSGNLTISGKIAAILELGAGFNPEYTGIENIYLNAMMLGYSREETSKKIDSIVRFADIGDFMNQPVKTYSSGMYARLAFAVSINVEPDILIIDEALSVGDVFFQAKCYKKLDEIKNNGTTILFVSHDLGSILKYCDRVLLLNSGAKLNEGDPAEMIDLYKKIMAGQQEENVTFDNTIVDGDKKQHLTLNPNSLEYGNKYAEIIDFYIKDNKNKIANSLIKGKEFKIGMKVKFNRDIQEPIFAFTIKDLKGTELIGTNSHIEKVSPDIAFNGSVFEILFVQDMNLQGGEYLLSFGCTGYCDDGLAVYHRLYDVCNITVISDKNSVGYYDCNSEISIRRC